MRKTRAEISLTNLRHNFEFLKKTVGESRFICPMVKANAYGHGDVEVTKTLMAAGAERVGVCLVEEGAHLRRHGIRIPILVFDIFDDEAAKGIIENELTPVLSTWLQLESLARALQGKLWPIHVKFNTGMNRLGFDLADAERVKNFIAQKKCFLLQGICTHLRNGDDAGKSKGVSETQLKKILQLRKIFNEAGIKFHALNSSAVFSLSSAKRLAQYADLGVRPGIGLYDSSTNKNLKPVMQIKSQIVLSRFIEKGEKVSYSGRWTAKKKSVIGVVPIGYEDGYFRAYSNKAEMLFRGKRVPVIGTVCMDYTMVDLTKVCGGKLADVGEEIAILGQQGKDEITASELGGYANTISYEVLTSVGNRIPRVYLR
jgi:alanine racemase